MEIIILLVIFFVLRTIFSIFRSSMRQSQQMRQNQRMRAKSKDAQSSDMMDQETGAWEQESSYFDSDPEPMDSERADNNWELDEAEERARQAPTWRTLLEGAPGYKEVIQKVKAEAEKRQTAAPVLTTTPQQQEQTRARVVQSTPQQQEQTRARIVQSTPQQQTRVPVIPSVDQAGEQAQADAAPYRRQRTSIVDEKELSQEELQKARLRALLQDKMLPFAILSAEVLSPPLAKRRFRSFR